MITRFVNEATTSYHNYELLNSDGDVVSAVEKLEWKLSDGSNILQDWTTVSSDTSGTISVSSALNTIQSSGKKKRFLTIRATYNAGEFITEEEEYLIVNLRNV